MTAPATDPAPEAIATWQARRLTPIQDAATAIATAEQEGRWADALLLKRQRWADQRAFDREIARAAN